MAPVDDTTACAGGLSAPVICLQRGECQRFAAFLHLKPGDPQWRTGFGFRLCSEHGEFFRPLGGFLLRE